MSIFTNLKGTIQEEFIKEPLLKDYERERFSINYRKILSETVIVQLITIGARGIKEAGRTEELLRGCLSIMGNRYYCTRCHFCEVCDNSSESMRELNELLQELVLLLFEGR